MTTIEVVDGGFLTTVQDLGRPGYQRYGVPVSGAMDPYSLRVANILLGNDQNAAALEITLIGPKLQFLADTVIAMAGAHLAPRLNGHPVSTGHAFRVPPGSLLTFDGPMDGKRAYLVVPGGFDVPVVMGSRSTYVRGGLGGHEGRALRPGDRLSAVNGEDLPAPTPIFAPAHLSPTGSSEHRLRVTLGPQDDAFTPKGIATFFSGAYTVSQQSDRVGYRLEGPIIEFRGGADIVSDGIPAGAVQVTGDGQPVALMADRGTTGGYTKIGSVIGVDVGELAQSLPGNKVTFSLVSIDEAHRLLKEREEAIEEFRRQVESAPLPYASGMRLLVDNRAFEVQTSEGRAVTRLEPFNHEVRTYRRTVTASVNDREYTFEVEVQG